MSMRPLVGITIGDDDRRAGIHVLREDYVRSVEQAGGLPVLLAPGGPDDALPLLHRLDGLLLSGGGDIDPVLYGEEPHPRLGRVNRRRDDFELALVREALRQDRPILAICRGLQVLNVASGGTLVQDLPSSAAGGVIHDAPGRRWSLAHPVAVTPGSRLREILGRDTVLVNSFHHQAADRVGKGLSVSARSVDDGLVEGLEIPERRFVLAVQWHPESFWKRPATFRPLFEAHVAACRKASVTTSLLRA